MKRKKPLNTTKPTLDRLAADGYTAQNVEVYLPWCRRKRDFCNFADILAFKPGETGVLAVQTTTRSNARARLKKCLESAHAHTWLAAGNRLEVWGWQRVREGRKATWKLSVFVISSPPLSPNPKLSAEMIHSEKIKKNLQPQAQAS